MTRVLVVGGGQNAEHEVSLASAAAVAAALTASGHEVRTTTIARDGVWWSGSERLGESPAASLAGVLALITEAEVVFPAVHGTLGEDGALAALCALAGTRAVGSGLRAGAIGMDKEATKLVADAAGLRTARGRVIDAADRGDVEFEGEVVVKPVAEAGGVRWAAPPLEIHAAGLFDTAMKYDGSARFQVPADLAGEETAALKRAAVTMFDALGCAGVARMDFFLTAEGPVLNEVNTMPGLTALSQVPRMFAAAGVTYADLVSRLVRAAEVPTR